MGEHRYWLLDLFYVCPPRKLQGGRYECRWSRGECVERRNGLRTRLKTGMGISIRIEFILNSQSDLEWVSGTTQKLKACSVSICGFFLHQTSQKNSTDTFTIFIFLKSRFRFRKEELTHVDWPHSPIRQRLSISSFHSEVGRRPWRDWERKPCLREDPPEWYSIHFIQLHRFKFILLYRFLQSFEKNILGTATILYAKNIRYRHYNFNCYDYVDL